MEKGNREDTAPRLQIRLFGAFDVQINGVAIPPLRSRKVQWLLALLVLRHNQALDRVWLAGTLWPDSAHSQAMYNLRQSLSNLRHVLGEVSPELRASMVNSLSIDLAHADADVLDFDAAIMVGDETALQRAVMLYRGPLLEGCLEEWVFAERRVREENYLSALETLAALSLSRGECSMAVSYLRPIIQVNPLREQAQRALIQALAAGGDYGAAVQTYRDLRLLLRRELNTDPDPQTQSVFAQIRGDARRQMTETRPQLQIKPTPSTPPRIMPMRRLPCALTPLVGRETEMQEIVATLNDVRLLTLTGPGGVGKTRMAIAVAEEVAEQYPDGVCFVEFASLSDPTLIVQAVVSALQVEEEPGHPLSVTLTNYLQTRTLLLILDNCEHLLDACARLADGLLKNCAGVSILATSRQTLGLTGEVGWRVPSLSTPALSMLADRSRYSPQEWLSLLDEYEAVHLFVQRAQQARPSFQILARNVGAVARICTHLDGIPLALELAAARVRSLSVEEINSKLDDRFALLTGGSRAALPRQQTLRALMDWSYDLLTDPEKTLLRRLTVFAGGWVLQAAEQVCSGEVLPPDSPEPTNPSEPSEQPEPSVRQGVGESIEAWEVLDLLTSLADKSLVQVEEQEDAVRYRMLETVRQYAAESLHRSGEEPALKSRHWDYFLALAEEAEPNLIGAEQALWLDRLEREHDNLRAALERKTGEAAQRLAGALWRFWVVRGYLSEGRERLTTALSHPESRVPDSNTGENAQWRRNPRPSAGRLRLCTEPL